MSAAHHGNHGHGAGVGHGAAHAARAVDLNEDPHGEGHHEHVIVSFGTLTAVLLALLALTALTMGASFAERAIALAFDIEIPQIVNAIIAMSIALVKGTLVCLFFMGLKYDNKVNAVVLGFTIFAVILFLWFTMMDLGTRGVIYDYKGKHIQAGGQGISTLKEVRDEAGNVVSSSGVNTGGKPIAIYWRDVEKERLGPEAFEAAKHAAHAKAGKHHDEGPATSTANRQVVRTGLTPDLYGPRPASGDGHGGGHGGAKSGGH